MNINDLKHVTGIGDKLSEKILDNVGGEENLTQIIKNKDLDKLSSIEGISQRKAIKIMNALLGNPQEKFLKNERAIVLYDDIINKILELSNTDYSRNRIRLLAPTTNVENINKHLDFVMDAKDFVNSLPINTLRGHMKKLHESEDVKSSFDSSKLIIVESYEDRDYLVKLGLNKYYSISVADNSLSFQEEIYGYELVYYVYREGFIDFGDMSNLLMVSIDSPIYEIVPDIIIDYFKVNKELYYNVFKVREILNYDSVCGDINGLLDLVDCDDDVYNVNISEIVSNIKHDMDEELKNNIKNIDIAGDEVLDLLNNDFPPKLEEIFTTIMSKANEKLKEKTKINFDPYIKKYPIEIDETEIQRAEQEQNKIKENNTHDKKTKIAAQLEQIKKTAEQELKETMQIDYKLTLGTFAKKYQLNKPKITENIKITNAIHLDLALEENIQKITYHLTPQENISLLTGANSGGKTTLLETIGQISIMTQMGLPVPAEQAEIKILDEIYYFTKQRSLDAGAFETFLNTFIPITTTETEKLVLLDELEGITELEASVKIISSFIEMLKRTKSYGIIVTHMAKELSRYTKIRIDGIEAKGLDENYNLIVDRTPKMNTLARSTPELILKRIYENSQGKLKEIYGEILEKF